MGCDKIYQKAAKTTTAKINHGANGKWCGIMVMIGFRARRLQWSLCAHVVTVNG